MKKKREQYSPHLGSIKVKIRKMKLTLILTLFVFVCFGNSFSQVKVSLRLEKATIREVIDAVEQQTEYVFIYKDVILDMDQKYSINFEQVSFEEVLKSICKSANVNYEVRDDRQIILTKKVEDRVKLIQQEMKNVTGTVTGDDGQPIPGVSIIIEGTTIGTVTDFEGKFTLEVPASTKNLQFSFVGMKTQTVSVVDKTQIIVVMEVDAIGIEEIITIGYGTAKKSDLTGAVIRIDAKTFQNQPMTQLTDMLTGTVAGFYSRQGTSASGGGSMEIRGTKSLKASSNPMIVIDGVIYNGSIKDINPADIESIDILKDASSAAVFGARAAAGVIQITTKKGKKGKPIINFSASIGYTNETNGMKPYDGKGYQQFRRDYLKAVNPDNPSYYYDDPNNLPDGVTIDDWRNASDNPQDDNSQEYLARLMFHQVEIDNFNAGKQVDWYNEVMQTGLRQNYDASISGATDRVNYYWSIGYQNNEGIIIGDEYQTARTRLNLDLKVTDWLDIGVNSQFADRNQSSVAAEIYNIGRMSPYGSMFEEDGTAKWYPNSFPVSNPLINYYGQKRFSKSYNLFASMYAKFKLPFGIDYKISYQPRYSFLKDYNFWPSTTITGGYYHSQGYGTRRDASSFEWILDHLVHWK